MKQFNGYNETKAAGNFEKLPAGGYEGKILDAKVVTYETRNGEAERLEISIDITTGDWANYYKDEYSRQTDEDKKWKGVLRLFIPVDDGSDKDNFTKSIFKAATEAVEESNPGYHWNWDEKALKGKSVGVLVRDKEYDYKGKHGFAPEVFKFMDVAKIRTGKFKVPTAKTINGSQAAPVTAAPEVSTDDYPFD